jgi:3-oxoacyl-[acyl-carrier-protein] synthase-3
MERVYLDNIPKFGHCYASDPFINLASVRDTGLVKAGDLVLLVSAGLGAAFAATLVQIGERRGR